MINNKDSNIIKSNTEIFTIQEYVKYKKKYILKNIEVSDISEEYQYINNMHDKIFRKALEDKKNARRNIKKI